MADARVERSSEDVMAETVLTKDERDLVELVAPLGEWLAGPLGADGPVQLLGQQVPSGSGLSNVTLLLDCAWRRDGEPVGERLVIRIAPDESAFPVFPTYDLQLQYDVMAGVAAHSDVPVPQLVGIEPTGTVVGSPFLVMRAVEGRAPADNPPYVFGGWLHDANPEERATLEEATVSTIAHLHQIPDPHAVFPRLADLAGDDPLRAHVAAQRAYYAWTHREDGVRIPLLERTFDWLEEHWPEPAEAVLSWGDARPGNILFDRFTPAAVLDWEMAALAPREVDLGWYVFIHRFFQDIAVVFELPGLPDLARPETVAATYERLTGHQVRDLDWYVVYAALRHGIVMAQIKRRMVRFGEDPQPEEPDDYVMHRAALEQLIGGAR